MNLTESIAPKSDQLNADDLMSGPITVTIREVAKGTPEQPIDVHLVEYPGRAYRPSKSMRRVLVSAWGVEGATYPGHQLTLMRNPEITFGREKVGGIEIAAMSHIDKALTVALTSTRGHRKNFTVQPLTVTAPKPSRDWMTELTLAGDDLEAVASLGKAASDAHANPADVAQIRARWNELKGTNA